MKIVITTQIRENYGDATNPYWKFKGGDTYVVPNLSVAQTLQVKERGIPTLKALIETRNEGFEEYVVDWSILDDDATVCEPWETPFNLYWEQGRWVARRTVENGEYGYMRSDVASKTEGYDMLMGGDRENYVATYTMRNGDVVDSKDVETYLNKAA
jgi:hypothetical protein